MANPLKANISQAISDFDAVKSALEYKGVEVGDAPTSEYGTMIDSIYSGGEVEPLITDARYLFASDRRSDIRDQLIPQCKACDSAEGMFYQCTMDSIDVSKLDVSEMTSAKQMFYKCGNLKTLDLSAWNTPMLRSMEGMFIDCQNLKTIDVSDLDTHNVTNMESVFTFCYALESLDVSKWNTSNVTSFNSIFSSCKLLKNIDVSNFDTHEATNMNGMFGSCASLESIDMSKWDTRKVTLMTGMFNGCSKLKEIIGFSSTNLVGSTIGFPCGGSSTNYLLKRLTFKIEGLDGLHAIRSNIKIPYCSFRRAGMVEMFNTLTDVSNMTHTTKNITITGNPCITGTLKVAGTGTSGISIGSYADFVAECDAFYGDLDRTGATVSLYKTGTGWLTYDPANVTEEDFNFTLVRFNAYTANFPESDLLTDEDRAIATAKGWTLVE